MGKHYKLKKGALPPLAPDLANSLPGEFLGVV